VAALAVFAVGVAIGCGADDGGGSGDGSSGDATEGPEGISVVRGKQRSFCLHDLIVGKIDVYVTLRNKSGEARSVSITPVRYYSDGTDNRSALDTFTLDVPARGQKGGFVVLDVDADHLLTDCAVQLDGGRERPIPTRVE